MGHVISKEGISVDIEKIEAIVNWPTPRNVTNVISFMGLAEYYMKFIGEFCKVAHPITYLQRKQVKFLWSQKCEESFQLLKKCLLVPSS